MAQTIGEHTNKDLPFAVIHVGPHKTASSTLQQFLVTHTGTMQEDKYFVPVIPGGGSRRKRTSMLANCFVNKTEIDSAKGWFGCGPKDRNRIMRYFEITLNDTIKDGSNIIMSSEEFDHVTLNVTELLSYFVPFFQVHIVMHYRRFHDWLFSFFNQEAKNGHIRGKNHERIAFQEWLSHDSIESFQQIYTLSVYERFKPFEGLNISIINMHDGNKTVEETFFCNHVNQATHTCNKAKLSKTLNQNPSVDLDYLIFRDKIRFHHSIRLSRTDKRNKQIEEKFRSMKDVPLLCPSSDMKETLLNLILKFEMALTPESWYNSKEGLQSLREDLDAKMTSKFCSADAETILKSSDWQEFLTDLEK